MHLHRIILLAAFCFSFSTFGQEIEIPNAGAIHLKFDNYKAEKHKKYAFNILIQSLDYTYRSTTDLHCIVSDKSSWVQQLPEGTYQVVINIRSNYSLTIREVKITQDRVSFIKIDMLDIEKRFRKVRINREYRNETASCG